MRSRPLPPSRLRLGPALVLALALLPGVAAAAGSAPERVISIGGSITEIIFALGQQQRVIAVDSTSRHPAAAQQRPDVGYMRALAAEALLALEPDHIIAVADAGPPRVLAQLRAAGTPMTIVPDEPSPDGVVDKISTVARVLGVEAAGRALARRFERELAQVRGALAGIESTPSVLFLLSPGGGAPLVAGRETSAAGIIELAGGRNAVEQFEGYKPLTPEATVTVAPQFLLVTNQTLAALGGREALLSRPALAAAPAGRAGRLIAMDALLLLGFGPRTPAAVRELAQALHPEAIASARSRPLDGEPPASGARR